jgi:hypothetical protein
VGGPTKARVSPAGYRGQGGGAGSAASSLTAPAESLYAYNPRIRCIAATREMASM